MKAKVTQRKAELIKKLTPLIHFTYTLDQLYSMSIEELEALVKREGKD